MGRDMESVKRALRRRGYVLVRRAKHGYLFEDGRGIRILIPSTPSDKRGIHNLNGQIKRKENDNP